MKRKPTFKFKHIAINQRFDWVGGLYPSFFRPCRKTGPRTYVDDLGLEYKVGSVNATVYHVEPLT